MITHVLAPHFDTTPDGVRELLTLSPQELQDSPEFIALLDSLDPASLHGTLEEARQTLDAELPGLVSDFTNHYDIDHFPLSSFMLGNWILGFLNYPTELTQLPQIHANIPVTIIQEAIPYVLEMFGKMESGGSQWQKAFAAMALFVSLETDGRR